MSSIKFESLDNLSFQGLDDEAELIPLLTPEDEEEMNREDLPETLPILPLRNTAESSRVTKQIGYNKSDEGLK